MNGYDFIVFVVGILICEFPIYEVWKKLKRNNMNVVSNYECWIFVNSCKSIIDYKNELFHRREEYCLRTFEKLQDFGKALKKTSGF